MKKHITTNPLLWLAALICISLFLIFITNRYILTVGFYERNGQPMSGIPDTETLVYERIKKVVYLWTAIYLAVKVYIIAIILACGLFLADIKVSFRDLLRVVITCEFVFLVPAVVKLCWFWQDRATVDLISWQNFYFLSAASLFSNIKPAYLLPLQTLNIFELAYCLLLAGGIEKIAAVSFGKGLKIVCLSYLPALFTWIIFIVYVAILCLPQSY